MTEIEPIPALLPRDNTGHQFVVYADSCSGIPGERNETNLTAVNTALQRLSPMPEFICFPGDEIAGLTPDENTLREQWAYWLHHEMGWLNREQIPLYHTTANHTTYNRMSERVFADVLSYLPRNGPANQQGLSYYVRQGNLLMVFIHTLWTGLGGEGRVETAWLDSILTEQSDAAYKFVFGHHPVFSVNGFSGEFQRDVNREDGERLWTILVKHSVMAYWCSHMLCFDVQVYQGVLQILTAGAGTGYRMPPETEYLHLVQAAVDETGLRYQVIDTEGQVRERLEFPLPAPQWKPYQSLEAIPQRELLLWKFTGHSAPEPTGYPQTFTCAEADEYSLPTIWVGLTGPEQRLTISMRHSPVPGRSPHYWFGTTIPHDQPFELQLALHRGMGPGGLLWRLGDDLPWSSLKAASYWGLENTTWVNAWHIGAQIDKEQSFMGRSLEVFINEIESEA